jgi:hypothetical protein
MEKKFKAIAKENLKKEGWYEFEKGTEFKVTHITKPLIEVGTFIISIKLTINPITINYDHNKRRDRNV